MIAYPIPPIKNAPVVVVTTRAYELFVLLLTLMMHA